MGRHVLFSAQRNEGPFLLEWIAYHLVIGFDRVVIVSNDCTDGSDRLLDVLSRHRPIDHVVQVLEPPHSPQSGAQALARRTGLLRPDDWVCWIDADEFLNIHPGSGSLGDLLARMGDADAMCVNWKLFGAAGLRTWPGRQLHPAFNRCGLPFGKSVQYCKTLFRLTDAVESIGQHRPALAVVPPAEKAVWLHGDGTRLPEEFVYGRRRTGVPENRVPGRPRYALAQINHYAVRTPDIYHLRAARGRGIVPVEHVVSTGKRYTSRHFRRYNRNWLSDASIQRHAPSLQAELERLLALPDVASAQDDCLDAAGLRRGSTLA